MPTQNTTREIEKPRLRNFDIFILIMLPLFALALAFLLIRSPYHITSTLLFYGLPALYLLIRCKNYRFIPRDIFFVLIVSTPFAIIVDYIGILSGLWFDPQVIFTKKLLGVIPFEDIIWMYAAVYLIIIFYRTFFGRANNKLVHPRMIMFAIPAAIVSGVFFILANTNPEYFAWSGKYAYLILGTVSFLIPAALFLVRFPQFIKKLFWVIAYFSYATLLLELTASHLHQWVFFGTYFIRPFSLFGFGSVPVEELFFVGIVGPAGVIAFYEFFDNDRI